MTYTRGLCKTALLAVPLAGLGFGAQAADVLGTIQHQQQLSTFVKAIKSADMAKSLQGKGPYTIFAPTDQAFAQLPPGTGSYLMQKDNQGELKTLLQYHVVKGKELQPDQVLGKQTEVKTVEGGSLSVDGTGRVVMLVPTGLIATRVGDHVIYKREVAAVSAPAVEVQPAGQSNQQNGRETNQQGQQAQAASNSGNGQRQQQQTSSNSTTGNGRPQPQASSSISGNGQQQAQTAVTAEGNMPATKHQEQVLRDQPATVLRQTSAQNEGAMPSSPHQRQVLRGQQPGEQASNQQIANNNAQSQQGQSQNDEQGILRHATVVGHPILADNGVIYPIDAVLVPQKILSQLESQGQNEQGQNASPVKQMRQGQTKQKQAENG